MAITSKISNTGILVAITIIAVALFSIASGGFETSGNAAAPVTTIKQFLMPFPIDAWGYTGWGDCSDQTQGKAWADKYCIAKSYQAAQKCHHGQAAQRWKIAGTAAAPTKGDPRGAGTAFLSVVCTKTETPTSDQSTSAPNEFAMPFAVDAWGYTGWGDCSTQDKGKTWPDQYCTSKGYTEAQQCYHETTSDRWRWAGTAKIPVKGVQTLGGTAFTKVKCVHTVSDYSQIGSQ